MMTHKACQRTTPVHQNEVITCRDQDLIIMWWSQDYVVTT